MIIREMTIDDYDEVYEMWQITTKRALSKADEKDQMERYLKHNAGMSQVAVVDGKIVGTVLAGHDADGDLSTIWLFCPNSDERK